MKKNRQPDSQTDRQTFKKLLVFFLIPILAITLTPGLAFAAELPCGHKDTDPGDHSEADCYVPGHYNCDGKTHDYHCVEAFMEEFMNENNGTNGPTVPTGPIGPDGPTEPLVPPQANNNNDMDNLGPLVPPPKDPPNKNADDYDDDLAPLVPDEPPIEIEVPDDEDLDLEVVKKEIKDLAERGFWSMKFEDAVYVATWSLPEAGGFIDWKQTLNLTLDQEGPGGTGMYGDYYGKGTLDYEAETSRAKASYVSETFIMDILEGTYEGPFTANVWLDPIDPAKADEDIGEQVYQHLNLTGLDPSKDPDDEIGIKNYNRNRIKQTVGDIVGYGGSSSAIYEVSGLAHGHKYNPHNSTWDYDKSKEIENEIEFFVAPFVFSSGVVKLHLYPQGGGFDPGYFWGRISRVVDGKELV